MSIENINKIIPSNAVVFKINEENTSTIYYQENIFPIDTELFNNLWEKRPSESQKIKMFGKEIDL
jgi:hypothetical protein